MTQISDAQPISHAHLPRLLDGINWKSLDQLIALYFKQHLFPLNLDGEWKDVDGKALRGTLKSGEK